MVCVCSPLVDDHLKELRVLGHLREDLLPNPHPHTSFDPVLLDAERSTAILKALRECGASPQKMMEVHAWGPPGDMAQGDNGVHAAWEQAACCTCQADAHPVMLMVQVMRDLPVSHAQKAEFIKETTLHTAPHDTTQHCHSHSHHAPRHSHLCETHAPSYAYYLHGPTRPHISCRAWTLALSREWNYCESCHTAM